MCFSLADLMAFFRKSFSRHALWQTVPYITGLLGLLATAWLAREVWVSDQDSLRLSFLREAQQQVESLIHPLEEQVDRFALMQRTFHTLGEVDEQEFESLLEPMSQSLGLRAFAWAPKIEGKRRSEFEREGKAHWGETFAIRETGPDGSLFPAPRREVHYPVQYQIPTIRRHLGHGIDLYAQADRHQLIKLAIETGTPVSSGPVPSIINPEQMERVVIFVAPVYRTAKIPLFPEERRNAVRGVLVASLDIGILFDMTFAAHASQFHVRLLEFSEPGKPVRTWSPENDPLNPAFPSSLLRYTRNFDLAGHLWTIQVDAGPEWQSQNTRKRAINIAMSGVLLSMLLALALRRLSGRSALADALEISYEDARNRQRRAETWATKLSMVVAQNPAAILITDTEGRIEYVNDMFCEMTGYERKDVTGKDVHLLGENDQGINAYRELRETVSSGEIWKGERQNRRRDGTPYWERVLVAPIKDQEDRIINYMAIREDITALKTLMIRLQKSESRFRGAMSSMVEGLTVLSSTGICRFANHAAENILGYPEHGLQDLDVRQLPVQLVDEEGNELPNPLHDLQRLQQLCTGRNVRNRVTRLRFPDGTIRWLEINTAPLDTVNGEDAHVVLTFSDITERRHVEEKLRLAFEAIRHSGEGILMTDAQHRIISANPAFESVTGHKAGEIIGSPPVLFMSARQKDGFLDTVRETLERDGHWQGEVWNRRKNGEAYPEWLGVSAVREPDGKVKYFVYIFSDMTERKAAQERIEFLAHHDPLTGLPNRLLLRDRMAQAMALATRTQSRVALMFLDLDRFKKINDSLGHPVGDALLKGVVERLKACVRESDTISRQGGDEFIIVLNDVRDSDAVSRVAEKIHERMSNPFVLGEHTLSTSFSIGVALFPDDSEDFDSLMQKADTAMYHAKEAGRNSYRFFTEQMNLQVVEHMTLETQLRRALENGEFVLHYQPQLDLQERTIVGVEALIRWNSPDGGLVPPSKFIPIAEESGLIVQIGAWVLREACRQARAWQESGLPPFVVAVNLSAIQFRRPDLVNSVINALVLSDLDSQWLELELTESILIQDTEATLDTVRRLKALGVQLSVDDFGTGYSSLTYLKRFAVDKLKIDQSFVRDLVSDPDDAAIVRAIIQMAHSLKLKTIAEGVETEELCNLLQLFHCDEVQGYWLARPMPPEELEAFVRNYSARPSEG